MGKMKAGADGGNPLAAASPFISSNHPDLLSLARRLYSAYVSADPFPHAVIDGLFDDALLHQVAKGFPPLEKEGNVTRTDHALEVKLGSIGEYLLADAARDLVRFLNAQPFLDFLEKLTGIGGLIPDPYLIGGGYHETPPGGFLKIQMPSGHWVEDSYDISAEWTTENFGGSKCIQGNRVIRINKEPSLPFEIIG